MTDSRNHVWSESFVFDQYPPTLRPRDPFFLALLHAAVRPRRTLEPTREESGEEKELRASVGKKAKARRGKQEGSKDTCPTGIPAMDGNTVPVFPCTSWLR